MNIAMDLIREALLGGSGGGGGGGDSGIAELVKTESLGPLSTTSTTEVNTGLTISVSNANSYDAYIIFIKAKESPTDYLIGTATVLFLNYQSGPNTPDKITNVTTIKNKYNLSHKLGDISGVDVHWIRTASGSTEYGVYVKNSTYADNTIVNGVYMKYNADATGTINGNFDAYVYGIKFKPEI